VPGVEHAKKGKYAMICLRLELFIARRILLAVTSTVNTAQTAMLAPAVAIFFLLFSQACLLFVFMALQQESGSEGEYR